MDHLISIIIPVYRAEAFLDRCMQSVLNQTYQNLEIILVDDGSPDGCPGLCDGYAARESRVRVIHKQNGGAASARNAGLDAATGRYVCFVDSDDYLRPESVEVLTKAIVESDGQYAAGICGYADSGRVKCDIPALRTIHVRKEPEALLEYLCTHGSYSPYAKIFDSSVICRNRLRFNESHKCSEDSLFIRQYMKHCEVLCLTPHVVYHYNTQNENSLSKRRYEAYSVYFHDKLQALKELTDGLPISRERQQQFLSQRAIHGIRIGLNHYFRNWDDKRSRLAFAELVIKVLMPWVTVTDPEITDRQLARWWKRNRDCILQKDPERIYRMQCRQEFVVWFRSLIGSVKKKIKRMVHR